MISIGSLWSDKNVLLRVWNSSRYKKKSMNQESLLLFDAVNCEVTCYSLCFFNLVYIWGMMKYYVLAIYSYRYRIVIRLPSLHLSFTCISFFYRKNVICCNILSLLRFVLFSLILRVLISYDEILWQHSYRYRISWGSMSLLKRVSFRRVCIK